MTDKYTIARLKKGNETFEILVDPESALGYRKGKTSSVSKVLVSDTVFSDANKGTKVSEEALSNAFGTSHPLKIAEKILKKGTIQLTTEQRRNMREEKRKQIIAFISKQCVDPKTNLPHPPRRVKQAMEQIHYPIDPFKSTEEQAEEIVDLLRPILPLKTEKVSVEVSVPPKYAPKVYGTLKGYGKIKHEEWRGDGSWYGVLQMPAGLYGPFLEKIGEASKGKAEAKMVS